MNPHQEYPNLLQFHLFKKEPRIVHFSSTRVGGVSDGAFASLNLGNYSDDNPLHIFENRTILARLFHKTPDEFIVPHQTHGSEVIVIDQAFLRLNQMQKTEILYGIDATITREKNLFVCATTADCVPILLFDTAKQVAAAIHAGWRGTVQRIVEKTIDKMTAYYQSSPSDIIAGIGPAVSLKHYEVGEEVERMFENQGFDLSNASFRENSNKKLQIDLKEINRQELLRLGVLPQNIEKTDLCTFEKEEWFFSARRQTVHSGRMLTGIMIK